VIDLAFLLAAYLYGSVPFVHLIAKARGKDLRKVGSGNVGAGNLWQTVGPLEGALGLLLDMSKGLLPVLLAAPLGRQKGVTALAAVAGVAGQCWPFFLGLSGGRGNSAALAAALALAPRALSLALVPMAMGALKRGLPILLAHRPLSERARFSGPPSRSLPLGIGLGFALLPGLAWALKEPPSAVLACSGFAVIIFLRRLTAGLDEDLRHTSDKKTMLLNRLLYDRSWP